MRFWDSSAIVPLYVAERRRDALLELLAEDETVVVWWGTPVEVTSALARLERDGGAAPAEVAAALQRLESHASGWQQVLPTDNVRRIAQRLLRVHPLRAADALQLAAALEIAGQPPSGVEFVCLDERLATAARREGLRVLPE